MYICFHTTKIENLVGILKNGLQPLYGTNSSLIADERIGKVRILLVFKQQ